MSAVVLESLPHADDIVDGIAKPLVEVDDGAGRLKATVG